MSFPLTDLARQLAGNQPILGRVVALNGNKVSAATPQGLRLATAATTLAVGDRVVIREGLAHLAPAARVVVAV